MPAASALPKEALLDYEVRRDGELITVQGPYPMPPHVVQLSPQSAAYDIDMKQGDVITAVEDQPIVAFSQLKDIVESSEGRVLQLDVWRDGEMLEFALAPRRVDEPQEEGGFKTEWRIGIAGGLAFEPATERLGPVAAFGNGVSQVGRVIAGSVWHIGAGTIQWEVVLLAGPAAAVGGFFARPIALWLGARRLKTLDGAWIVASAAYLLWLNRI